MSVQISAPATLLFSSTGLCLLFCLLLSITHTSSGSANSFGEAAMARCFICVEVASFALMLLLAIGLAL